MSVVITIEKFENDDTIELTKELDTKHFCSEECACDYLFEEFEIEGILITDSMSIRLPEAAITMYVSDDDLQCEYNC